VLLSVDEYDREIEQRFPDLPWRTPLLVSTRVHVVIACRLCAARLGLKAEAGEIRGVVFTTIEAFSAHMAEAHKVRAN
jgi:hypothetical protein